VLISPNDTDIVRDGSEERRKFFDGVISQINREYLETLIKYNKVLLQRNALLKQFAEKTILMLIY
jgi:DNA replication and repair protein RecF